MRKLSAVLKVCFCLSVVAGTAANAWVARLTLKEIRLVSWRADRMCDAVADLETAVGKVDDSVSSLPSEYDLRDISRELGMTLDSLGTTLNSIDSTLDTVETRIASVEIELTGSDSGAILSRMRENLRKPVDLESLIKAYKVPPAGRPSP